MGLSNNLKFIIKKYLDDCVWALQSIILAGLALGWRDAHCDCSPKTKKNKRMVLFIYFFSLRHLLFPCYWGWCAFRILRVLDCESRSSPPTAMPMYMYTRWINASSWETQYCGCCEKRNHSNSVTVPERKQLTRKWLCSRRNVYVRAAVGLGCKCVLLRGQDTYELKTATRRDSGCRL
jgi:hypothetical protein